MTPKTKSTRKPAAEGKAAKTARHRTKSSAKASGRKHAMRKSPQPRVWRRVAKLAGDALDALEAGNLAEVRLCLEAIRAVGLTAEQS